MKGIVIYDTAYGNTQKIAETITATLKESGVEVDLFDVKNAEPVPSIHNHPKVLIQHMCAQASHSIALCALWLIANVVIIVP